MSFLGFLSHVSLVSLVSIFCWFRSFFGIQSFGLRERGWCSELVFVRCGRAVPPMCLAFHLCAFRFGQALREGLRKPWHARTGVRIEEVTCSGCCLVLGSFLLAICRCEAVIGIIDVPARVSSVGLKDQGLKRGSFQAPSSFSDRERSPNGGSDSEDVKPLSSLVRDGFCRSLPTCQKLPRQLP